MASGGDNNHFAAKLRKSVVNGDVTSARRLIKGGINIDSTFWYESSLLHEAVASCNIHMVQLILKARPDINGQNKDGRTALHIACRHGNRPIFEALIDAGADVNIQTQDEKTCLHVALWRKHVDLAERLLDCGANVNTQDNDGWSPLHWCTSSNLHDFTSTLINAGATIDVFNRRGLTPLHISIQKDLPDLVRLLVKHGSDVNLLPKTGNLWSLTRESKMLMLLLKLGYSTRHNPELLAINTKERKNIPPRVLELMEKNSSSVPSLKGICRSSVRKRLFICHRNRTILKSVSLIGLPKVLQDYVTMTEELDNG